MKKTVKQILNLLLALCLVFTLLPVSASAALDSRVEKAISWAVDIANDNSHGYSMQNRYGPDYDCSSFVAAAFRQGGFDISATLWTGNMEQAFKAVGFKAYSASSVTLQRGDILLRHDNVQQHTELYIGNNQCVAAHWDDDGRTGDSGGHEIEVRSKAYCDFCNYKQYTQVLRYEGNPPSIKVNEYFSCDVTIQTTKGKAVNLYKNPTDSSRNDYYDRGGNLHSTYGAKVSDGSTWYRVLMSQNGNDVNLWLNAASSGVKIINNERASVSATPSSLTLNLANNISGTVRVNISGPYGGVGGTGDSDGVVRAEWGDYGSGYAVAKFTALKVGTDNFTFQVYDETKTKVIATTTVRITVTAPTYTVSYNANGGSGAPSPQTKEYNKVLTLSSVKPVRAGYTFKGWTTSSGSSSISYQPGSSYYSDKSVTLYAVWEKNKVESSIALSTNALVLDPGDSKTMTISFTGEGIDKLHYSTQNPSVFDLNWGNTDWGKGTSSLTVTGKNPGQTTVTIYLLNDEGKSICSQDFKVTVNSLSYTVSYNANGGSGAPSSQSKQHDKTLTLSSVKPTRDGYTFKGWATSSWASSAQYQPGSSYTGNSDLTLYAVWVENPTESSITFSLSSVTLNPGESKTVYANFKGDGIAGLIMGSDDTTICTTDFAGVDDWDWNGGTTAITVTALVPGETTVSLRFMDQDGNEFFQRSFSVTVSGSSYTVYFDANGGEVQPFSTTVANDGTYGSLPTPTRSGYTFEGWYTSRNDGQLITSGTTVNLADDQTLYAHWKKNSTQSQATVYFDDVNPDDWFAESVQWAIERGITVGTSNTKFSPYETCSVAQILTFIWRANGSPEPTFANVFTDVPSGSYYEKPAVWAKEMGMVSGSKLDPLAPCTRAMAVEYLWKAANSPYTSASNKFVDVPSSYSQAVDWAVAAGITYGTSETTFSPDVTCTRAQIITFLYRNMA